MDIRPQTLVIIHKYYYDNDVNGHTLEVKSYRERIYLHWTGAMLAQKHLLYITEIFYNFHNFRKLAR